MDTQGDDGVSVTRVSRLLGLIKVACKDIETAALNGVSNALHMPLIKRQIVDGTQLRA
jgi:hypothetical protein